MEQNKKERLHILFLLLMSFAVVAWTIKPINGLIYEDYSLLSRARFDTYERLFNILPNSAYNDRPIQLVFLSLLIQWFGESYAAFHIVYVLYHLWNVYLLYRIVTMILREFGQENKTQYAFITAAIFGVYPNGLLSVQWICAGCALQCCNFIFLSMWAYFKSREEKEQYRNFFGVCSVVGYFLSLRCMEISLAYPVILIVYEIALCLHKKKKEKKSHKALITMLIVMIFYAILLLNGNKTSIGMDPANYMEFSPITMGKNILVYWGLYFNVLEANMQYLGMTNGITIALGLLGTLLLYTMVDGILRKNWNAILSLAGVIGSLAVVLPVKDIQHRSNLYLPSAFIAIYLMLTIKSLIERMKIENVTYVCGITLVSLGLLYWAPGVKEFRVWWLENTKKNIEAEKSIARIEEVPRHTVFYVIDKTPGYDVISYGPGHVFNLVFDDYTIDCKIVEEFPENPLLPCVFLEIEDGKAIEVKRDETIRSRLQIKNLSKYEVDSNGSGSEFDVGVVYEKPFNHTIYKEFAFDDMKLWLNGQETFFIRGEDFISFTIPEELRVPDTVIEVSLYSEDAGGESDKMLIEVH